jgi:hypothetical protein
VMRIATREYTADNLTGIIYLVADRAAGLQSAISTRV